MRLLRGERICLVSPNGAGKLTLLKIIAEIIPVEAGTRELGHNVSVGYFSHQRVEVLNWNAEYSTKRWIGFRAQASRACAVS